MKWTRSRYVSQVEQNIKIRGLEFVQLEYNPSFVFHHPEQRNIEGLAPLQIVTTNHEDRQRGSSVHLFPQQP